MARRAVRAERALRVTAPRDTVRYRDVSRQFPWVAISCIGYEPITINGYRTPPFGLGIEEHADPYPIVVCQIAGSKLWHIEQIGDVETRPGDTLTICAGLRHVTSAGADGSLHLAVGFHGRSPFGC